MKTLQTMTSLFLCIFCVSSVAYAWDNVGHMAVAGLAYDELTTEQQDRLVAILKNHPKLNFITEGFPDPNIDGRDLVMAAATWPDLARSHTSKPGTTSTDDITDNGYEEHDPAIKQVKFDDGRLHRGWHFIDNPLWVGHGTPPSQLPKAPEVNAVGVVKVLITQLKSNEADQEKAYDLGWLLHLVGDLHQPMHTVNGISATLPEGDRGGNLVEIKGATDGASELHAFWDEVLGKTAPPEKTPPHHPHLDKDVATADDVIAEVQKLRLNKTTDNNLDPAAWANESLRLAKRDAYDLNFVPMTVERPGASEPTQKLQTTLDPEYGVSAKRVARKQVRRAGHRLALILKDILQ
jgi:S1/P1 Nuclease